jgi:hypothetical protein
LRIAAARGRRRVPRQGTVAIGEINVGRTVQGFDIDARIATDCNCASNQTVGARDVEAQSWLPQAGAISSLPHGLGQGARTRLAHRMRPKYPRL